MGFVPLAKMWDRVNVARADSDTSLFLDLMYLGEMVVKLVTAGMVVAISDDARARYRQEHKLVRADGVGTWKEVLDEVLVGSTCQSLNPQAYPVQQSLTQPASNGTWQYEAVALLHGCLTTLDGKHEKLSTKVQGRRWFDLFATLRNDTRGHGAPTPAACSRLCAPLEKSITLVASSCPLFSLQWAYLYRNQSGKYRVIPLSESCDQYDQYKTSHGSNGVFFEEGVHIHFDGAQRPVRLDLVWSDRDIRDFFFPNGSFDGRKYELISYVTGTKKNVDASSYLIPPDDLPGSETEGLSALEMIGECHTNLPKPAKGYIHRDALERKLYDALDNAERHPLVTLVGPGGIGKTSLALSVLHAVAQLGQYGAVLWFSSRDTDLLPQGPKPVRKGVSSEHDIARQFANLVSSQGKKMKRDEALAYLAKSLNGLTLGFPVLFVFDNFETASSPADLFAWLDTQVRPPNKILITTRMREFNGDYTVSVDGMTDEECNILIDQTSQDLGIASKISTKFRNRVISESAGHPYVVKVLLGEAASSGKFERPERVLEGKDKILQALFERTFVRLRPDAQRVFFMLCSRQTVTVPILAIEAVLLKRADERIDVSAAVDELYRYSFIERSLSEDGQQFAGVPLVAALFGLGQLAVSAIKSIVETDVADLDDYEFAKKSSARQSIAPHIQRRFQAVRDRIENGNATLADDIEALKFIARAYPPAWLDLASLCEIYGGESGVDQAKEAIRSYLRAPTEIPGPQYAWNLLASLCKNTSDYQGEIHALVEMCSLPDTDYSTVSMVANRLNAIFNIFKDRRDEYRLDTDEKRVVVQRLVQVMESRISEANADDCSRLAWLYMHLQNETKACEYANRGLYIDGGNPHCLKLIERLRYVDAKTHQPYNHWR